MSKSITPRDNIYASHQGPVEAFEFDDRVAGVFDDMIDRSVPGYRIMLEMIGVISRQFSQADTCAYDLGCSLGASTLSIRHNAHPQLRKIVGIDNSEAMINRCQHNIDNDNTCVPVELRQENIEQTEFAPCSLVALNFTLQFIDPAYRAELLSRIANSMVPNGALILSEKIHLDNTDDNNLLIDLHHGFKRAKGYSELEIANKRAAIENVLISETIDAHKTRLLEAGFSSANVWFQCFNFISIVACK